VVKHNQMDLRGLAALFGKMNAMLSESADDSNEIESLDLFGLSRFLQRRGEAGRAQSACAQALAIGLPAEVRPKAQRELALMAKRRGEHARAAEIWQEIVADPQDGIQACEQLAIHFEHQANDLSKATEFAQLALAKLRRHPASARDYQAEARSARLEQRLLHRIARLKHRMEINGDTARLLPLLRPQAKSDAGGQGHLC
jgi:tetratricopeptide (TPR) repeat protein